MIHRNSFFRSCDLFFLYFSLSRNFIFSTNRSSMLQVWFKLIFVMLMDCPIGTSILARVLAVEMWNFIIFLLLVNSSGNWFAILCQWIILELQVHIDLYENQDEITSKNSKLSLVALLATTFLPQCWENYFIKWQSSKYVLKTSLVKGLKYLIIDGELKPT